MLPEDFWLPKASDKIEFQLWIFGNQRQGYPPFNRIQPCDIAHKSTRSRFADYLMLKLEQILRSAGRRIATPTVDQSNDMFEFAIRRMDLPARTPSKRIRRHGQLGWQTVVNIIQKQIREQTIQ